MNGLSAGNNRDSAQRAPSRRKRCRNVVPPPWGKIDGRGPRLAIVALIRSADANGMVEFAHDAIDAYAGGSANSQRDWLRHLVDVGAIELATRKRIQFGLFGKDSYRIVFEDPATAKLASFFNPDLIQPVEERPDPSSVLDGLGADAAQKLHKRLPEIAEAGSKTDRTASNSTLPNAETTTRTYKEARASARASKSIIYHSLSDHYENDDQELREQIAEVLSVCGKGTEGVETERLIDSLEFHIPRAIIAGYDFDKDIVRCIRHYTKYERPRPLNRFDVTFDKDLPEWRAVRKQREAKQSEYIGRRGRGKDPQAENGFRVPGNGDQLDRALASLGATGSKDRRKSRLVTLRRMIAKYDSEMASELHDLRLQLPPHQRDLADEELIAALRPVYDCWKVELEELGGDGAQRAD